MSVDQTAIDRALAGGDLRQLTEEQRITVYKQTCASLNLNPLTMPLTFYTSEDGRVQLSINKGGADQLRKLHKVSVTGLTREITDGVVIYTINGAVTEEGANRFDSATGARSIHGLVGQDKANAIMAAESAAHRRLTISITGAGLPDQQDVPSTFPGGKLDTIAPTLVPEEPKVPAVNQAPAQETVDTRAPKLPGAAAFGGSGAASQPVGLVLDDATASGQGLPASISMNTIIVDGQPVPLTEGPSPEQLLARDIAAKVSTKGPEPEEVAQKLAAAVAHQPHTEKTREDFEPPPHKDSDQPNFFGESNEAAVADVIASATPKPTNFPSGAILPEAGGPQTPPTPPVSFEATDDDLPSELFNEAAAPKPIQPPAPVVPPPPIVTAPGSDTMPTQLQFKAFTARCTKLVRDVLQKAGKEGTAASNQVLPYILKSTNHAKISELSVHQFEEVLNVLEGAAQAGVPALITLLKAQGAK